MILSNIGHFLEGNYYHLLSKWDKEPPHIKEQALFRMSLCKDCLDNQSCLHCGCSTPALFYSPSKTDALSKWGKMLPPDLWEEFKAKHFSNDSHVTDGSGHIPAPAGSESDLSYPRFLSGMSSSALPGSPLEASFSNPPGEALSN